jgi:hypothetical protein
LELFEKRDDGDGGEHGGLGGRVGVGGTEIEVSFGVNAMANVGKEEAGTFGGCAAEGTFNGGNRLGNGGVGEPTALFQRGEATTQGGISHDSVEIFGGLGQKGQRGGVLVLGADEEKSSSSHWGERLRFVCPYFGT